MYERAQAEQAARAPRPSANGRRRRPPTAPPDEEEVVDAEVVDEQK